ncbi:MAG: hypothetical protein JWO68_870 [Actinomycetia bacterium]|nr:hypothetical protein [Actinomycetes bacterium]
MEVQAVYPYPGPRYQAPKLTAHELWRQRIDGFANNLILGLPAVPHDAAGNPPLSARIDLLA